MNCEVDQEVIVCHKVVTDCDV